MLTIEQFIQTLRDQFPKGQIMVPDIKFGHLATNLLMTLNSPEEEEKFLQFLKNTTIVRKYDIVNKFVNIFFNENNIIQMNLSPKLASEKVNIEFLSPNPTGPIHLAHCRNLIIGDTLANFLQFIGYDVTKEIYFNDVGVQVDKFFETIEHYHGDQSKEIHYKGDYMKDIAQNTVGCNQREVLLVMIKSILRTVKDFNVTFDVVSYESEISRKTKETIQELESFNMIEHKDGKKLLKSTRFGDDKDRVLERENGKYTYIGNDITYHKNKLDRGFLNQVLVLGMDHAGYFSRLKSGLHHWGINLHIVTYNCVKILDENNNLTKISKRGGNIITADDLLKELTHEVIRTEMLSKNYLQPLGLSIEKIKKNKDLSFYIKYANVRINSLAQQIKPNNCDLTLLTDIYSQNLIQRIIEWPLVLQEVHKSLDVHRLFCFALKLSQAIHSFLSNIQVLDANKSHENAKMQLLLTVQKILHTIANIMNIDLPEKI